MRQIWGAQLAKLSEEFPGGPGRPADLHAASYAGGTCPEPRGARLQGRSGAGVAARTCFAFV